MHDHLFPDGKVECIYHQLKQLATHIVFRPSEQLCIKTLAEVLRVSQTPVREALIRLQTEAIVSGERQRGFFAYYPSLAEHQDLQDMLAGMLRESIQHLANGRRDIDREHLDRIHECSDALMTRAAHPRPDLQGASVQALEELLAFYVTLGGNREILRVFRNILERTRKVRILILETATTRARIENDIPLINQALSLRDFRKASLLLQKHFAGLSAHLPELVKDLHWRAMHITRGVSDATLYFRHAAAHQRQGHVASRVQQSGGAQALLQHA